MRKNIDISIFFTDSEVGFFEMTSLLEHAIYGHSKLERGIIDNGYIKEPEMLFKTLDDLFRLLNIKPRRITFIVSDQNLLIRDIKIPKEDLDKQTINQYINEQTGKSIYFPFEEPAVSSIIREETDEFTRLIGKIVDSNLLHDYHDVFDRLGAKDVQYELSVMPIYEMYHQKHPEDTGALMLVNLYEKIFSIQIIENDIPIFHLVEEGNDEINTYYQIVENFVERIANYYQFNMRKGKQKIKKVLLFAYDDQLNEAHINMYFSKQLKGLNASVCETMLTHDLVQRLPKVCTLPFVAALLNQTDRIVQADFKISRYKKVNQYANYLMTLAFFIIAATLLVYLPFYALEEDIKFQQNRNNALDNQLKTLIDETPFQPTVSVIQQDYSLAYDFLSQKNESPSPYLTDLFTLLGSEVGVINYQMRTTQKEIILIITSHSEQALYEYVIDIYESYGMTTTPNDGRWMIERPSQRMTQPLVLEVTIRYA